MTGTIAKCFGQTMQEHPCYISEFPAMHKCADAGDTHSAEKLFEELQPTASTGDVAELSALVLQAYINAGDSKGAASWHAKMSQAGIPIRPAQATVLAEKSAREGNVYESIHWLKVLRSLHDGPVELGNDATKGAEKSALELAGASCTSACDPASRLHWLETAVQAGFTAHDLDVGSCIAKFCREDDLEAAYKLLDDMKMAQMTPNAKCYNLIVFALSKRKDFQSACMLIKEIGNAGVVFDRLTYIAATECYAKSGDTDAAVKLLGTMEAAYFIPNEQAYSAVIDGFARTGDPVEASKWILNMEKSGVQPGEAAYAGVIRSFARAGNPTGAMRWLTNMRRSAVKPSARCYNSVISAYAKKGDAPNALRWLQAMTNAGIMPDTASYTEIIRAYAKKGQSSGAKKYFNEMVRRGLAPDVVSYNSLIMALSKSGQSREVGETMKLMRQQGFEPNVITWSWAIRACSEKSNRGRSEADAEARFRSMIASGISPIGFTLDSLSLAVGRSRCAQLCTELGVDLDSIAGDDDKQGRQPW